MEKIIFQCETITPMFLAGADGKTPELRPPSIKAAMRFWWRAINGHLPLANLKEKEAEIFGGSGENEGRSKFNIKIKIINERIKRDKFPNHPVSVISKGRQFSINILEYLAYGTLEYKKELKQQIFIRDYLATNTSFEININYDKSINNKIDFKEIMGLVSCVGGLGSRARNGFGRFIVKNNELDLIKIINDLKSNSVVEYLTFNNATKLFSLDKNFDSWDMCLAELGKVYKSSREELENRHQFSKRQFIASPILENKTQRSLLDRHSKPYFFVIRKNSNNKFEGNIIFLSYNYLKGFDNPPKPQNELEKKFNQVTTDFNKILGSKMRVVI